MENYIVSARKYRPSTFGSVVGQKSLMTTLKNAIASDRLAHAYLFCGSRGVGKTSTARIFAKTINCEHPTADGNPCNECESCRAFNEGRSLNIIELDAASNNSVDDIRTLTDQVQVPPIGGKYRVFIVDEVHMLSAAAFNAFLKTLEEPPSYVIFILATTEKHKIIPTILSRCQIYDFNRITITDIVDHLEYVAREEGIDAERSALRLIAVKADGAMRDALSIFDQVAASSGGKITYDATIENLNMLDTAIYGRLFEAFMKGDVPGALLIYKEVRDKGFDSHFFINGLGSYLRDLMVAREASTRSLLDGDPETIAEMAKLAEQSTPEFFYQAMNLCNSADLNYRTASNKTFLVELLLIRLCQQLSPSPNFSGVGEGQLQPIATKESGVDPLTAPQGEGAAPAASAPQGAPLKAPQGAPQAAPTTASQTAPRMSAPAERTMGARRPRLSMSGVRRAQEQQGSPAAETERRSEPFTPEAVVKEWNTYIAAHPQEHIIINTMRTSMPTATDTAGRFAVKVKNDIQSHALGAKMHEITQQIRDALRNDSIEFVIEISQEPLSPIAWNDREVLEHLLKNEKFRDFAQRMQLTII